MLATPPFWASSNIALLRANIKPPVELVVGDLDEGIEPMQTNCKLNQPFIEHIPSFKMCQFMHYGVVKFCIRYICTWQDNTGFEKAN